MNSVSTMSMPIGRGSFNPHAFEVTWQERLGLAKPRKNGPPYFSRNQVSTALHQMAVLAGTLRC